MLPNFGFFGGSVWTNYLSGQSLSIAFTTLPLLRGILAFAGIAGGGIILLVAARHVSGAAKKHPGLGFGILLCLAGCAGGLRAAAR